MIHLPLRMVYTSLYQPYDHMVIFGMDTYGDFFIFFIFFSIETSIAKGFSMDFHGFQIAMFDF